MKTVKDKYREWLKDFFSNGDSYKHLIEEAAFEAGYETAKAEYEAELKEAVEVIRFYAEHKNWNYSDSSMQFDIYGNINPQDCYNEKLGEGGGVEFGGKKAREYFKKWSEGE